MSVRAGFRPLVALALALSCVSGVAALAAGPAAPPAPATVLLSAQAPHALPGLRVLGPLPAGTRLQVGVALQHPDLPGELAAFDALYTPGNPAFHRFLTPAAYAARFGVAPSVLSRVVKAVTAAGLSVGYVSGARDYLLLDGSAAEVERTFRVGEQRALLGSRTVFLNSTAPTVPSGVTAVLGLESITDPQLPRHRSAARPAQDSCLAGTCLGTLTPPDLWSTYDQPATDRGAGQQLGIIGDGDVQGVINDLRRFEQVQHLPRVNVRAVLTDDDRTYTAGEGEWALDSAATTGMAPDASRLNYYFGQTLGGASDTGNFTTWANDPDGPLQANYSVGGCEALNWALGSFTADTPVFRQIALEGRTLFTSTGDTGGSCTAVTGNGVINTGVPQVEWPASSQYVMAVGGTELYTTGGRAPHRMLEKAWDYTGGGSSMLVPAPAWQRQIAVVNGRCLLDGTGSGGPSGDVCRGLPDVAAVSGDILTNGYADVEGGTDKKAGTPTSDGGTSLSSPLWEGMWTRIQAAAPPVHGRYPGLGFAAPALYRLGLDPAKDARDFFDVALGQNGQHQALPRDPLDPTGWDYVSGLGVPDVAALMRDLAHSVHAVLPRLAQPRPDQFVVPTGAGCGPNGVFTRGPGGGAIVDGLPSPYNDDALDLVKVAMTLDRREVLTVTDHVVNLAADPTQLAFEDHFGYRGGEYVLLAFVDPVRGNSFELDSVDPTTGVVYTTLAGGLPGRVDTAHSTVSVAIPLKTLNTAIGAAPAIRRGSVLSGLYFLADRSPGGAGLSGANLVAADDITPPAACGHYAVGR